MKHARLLLLVACIFSIQVAWAQINWQPTNGPEGGANWHIYHNDEYAFYPTEYHLYRTADGVTWEELPQGSLSRISAGNNKLAAIKGYGFGTAPHPPRFVVSNDNGQTWVEGNLSPAPYYSSMAVCSQGIFVGHGEVGKFYKTTDDGQTWDTLKAPVSYCYDIWASDDRLFTRYRQKMWRLNTNGADWELISPTLDASDNFLNSFADGNNLYLSAQKSLWASIDNGQTWKKTTIPSYGNRGCFIKIGNRIYTDAAYNSLMYTDDFGATWQEFPVANKTNSSEFARAGTRLLVATYDQGVLYLNTNLKDWQAANSGIKAGAVYDMGILGQKLWCVGGSGAFSYDLGTQTWNNDNALPFPRRAYNILVVSPSGVLAAKPSASDEVAISTNGGANWDIKRIMGNYIIRNLYWVGETLYAATDYGSYYLRSTDYGRTWENLSENISGFAEFKETYYGVTRGNTEGKIIFTKNGGNTWTKLPSPNGLKVSEVCGTDDRLFALAGDQDPYAYQLYTTTDGQNWYFANYGLPNLGEFILFSGWHEDPKINIWHHDTKYLLQKPGWGIWVSLDSCKTWLPVAEHSAEVLLYKDTLYSPSYGRGLVKAPFPNNYGALSSGLVFKDDNGDGVRNPGEIVLPNVRIEQREPNAWYPFWFTQTGPDGRYSIGSYPGSMDTIRPRIFSPHLKSITPPYRVVTTGGTDRDFAVQLTPNITDGHVVHAGTGVPRPGFSHTVCVTSKNLGTLPLSGRIGVKLDPKFTFDSADPKPTAVIGTDSLVWDLPQLDLFASTSIKITGTVSQNAPLGAILQTTSSIITNDTDFNLDDNRYTTRDTIRGSYDPNEKKVTPSNGLTKDEILAHKPLVYTIFFQNTGTFEAERVRITDQLDTALNWESLRFLQASHKVTGFNLRPGGILEVIFDNIALPDSNSNEAASHGFVQFSIERKTRFNAGRTVNNKASIYFDFNAPIVTNTVSIGVPAPTVATQDPKQAARQHWLQIAPNPANQSCQVSSAGLLEGQGTLHVTDASGRLCLRQNIGNCAAPFTLKTSELANGVYWVQLFNEQGAMMGKLVVRHGD